MRERADRADDLGADRRVLAHDVPLGTAQPAGLLQDRVGHADLADVVQQRHLADRGRVLGVHPELARDLECQLEHRLGMRSGVVLARVERRQQRLPRGRLDLLAAAQLRALGGVQPVARDPRQDVEEAQVALVELRLRQAAQAAQRAVDRAVGAAHRHARVRADPRRGDERMAGGLRQHLGIGHELRRVARDHRVAPRVVARQREARSHAPVGGDVAVDLAQHELGFGQLGQVRQLHPEQLARRSEKTIHRSRIGPCGRLVNPHRRHHDRYAAARALLVRGRRGHLAHRVLGERGDREARIHPDVGRDRGSVADQEVLVAEDALAGIDHAARAVGADHRAAEDVRRGRDVRDRLHERALGDPAGALGQPLGEPVGDRDEGRVRAVGVLLGAQAHAAEPAAPRTQRDRVVERLHHQHDDRALGPAARPAQARQADRVARRRAEQLERPREPRAVADQEREERAHAVARVAVGDGLDVGVGIGVDARGDRHPLGHVGRAGRQRDGEDRLRVGPHQLAEPVGDAAGASRPASSAPAAGWCRARRRRRRRRASCAPGDPCAARRRCARS